MHVLVTGATGFVGSALVAALTASGHTVSAVSRDAASAKRRLPALTRATTWSPVDEPLPDAALEDVDAVVHLLGETVAGLWTPGKRRAIYDSRVGSTKRLVEAFRRREAPRVLVSTSAVGYYGDRGEDLLAEDEPPSSDFLARVCRDWEGAAVQAEAAGVRVVRLRSGLVMGPGPPLSTMLLPFRLGLGGPLGNGKQWWPWIHRDDHVRLIQFALEQNVSGAFNAVAPEPVRQKTFAKTLGRLLGRPAVFPAPAFLLRLLLRGFSAELIGSKRVVPERTMATGFAYRHPTLDGALGVALAQMDGSAPKSPG